ncbi:MAG: chorismate-binding protein [Bacteroidaceae bacterium]|nr:chorismate-binding protein [Bacteroidaceae bacterium]
MKHKTGLAQGADYVLFRLPEQNHYTLMAQSSGRAVTLQSLHDLDGREGFVLAPFVPGKDCPILLLQPDIVMQYPVPTAEDNAVLTWNPKTKAEEGYKLSFARFHDAVTGGRFQKLVLAHQSILNIPRPTDPDTLFLRACRLYPHQFVALIVMQGAGTWLMATPEVLLEGKGLQWQTMALAGTMTAQKEQQAMTVEALRQANIAWSRKNLNEQDLVTQYIVGLLRDNVRQLQTTGPYTTKAANLLHLRTDIRFQLSDSSRLGCLLDKLHPTPAVCGMPKDEARQWIGENEGLERRYYSGFCGTLCPQGESHLFVALRCMQLHSDTATLYAGGGIVADSQLQSEWSEVENKLQTMQNVLDASRQEPDDYVQR